MSNYNRTQKYRMIVPTETPLVAVDEGGETSVRRPPIVYNEIPSLADLTPKPNVNPVYKKSRSLWPIRLDEALLPTLEPAEYSSLDLTIIDLINELFNILEELNFDYYERRAETELIQNVEYLTIDDFVNYVIDNIPYYLYYYPEAADDIIELVNEILARYANEGNVVNEELLDEFHLALEKEFADLPLRERQKLLKKYELFLPF